MYFSRFHLFVVVWVGGRVCAAVGLCEGVWGGVSGVGWVNNGLLAASARGGRGGVGGLTTGGCRVRAPGVGGVGWVNNGGLLAAGARGG